MSYGALAGWLRDSRGWPAPYTRKTFHFLVFSTAAIVGLSGGFLAVKAFGSAIAALVLWSVMRGNGSRLFRALARPSDAPHEKYYVIVPLIMTALGGMLSNVLFGKMAAVGYVVTGWGDAIGEPVGARWGRHRYRVPTLTGIRCHRSLEGSAAVFLTSLAGAALVLAIGLDVAPTAALIAASMIAFVTTLVEAVTFHSLDNLTLQLASTAAAAWII
jgi:phytol kinase